MDILLVSFGSSGDIIPYIAIGKALKERNHKVTFITNQVFKERIEQHGITFFQVGTKEEFERISENTSLFHPKKAFEFIVQEIIIKYLREYYFAIEKLVTQNTVIISQSIAPAPRIAHEKLSVPLITLNLQPLSFWSIHKPPVFSGLYVNEKWPYKIKSFILNSANKHYIDKQYQPGINKFLSELSLPPQSEFFSKWLYSPQLVLGAFPEWFAGIAPDWPPNSHLTGFISLRNNSELSDDILEFLNSGIPTLVFTAGSAMQHAHRFFKVAVKATRKLNYRAILITSFPEQIEDTGTDLFICNFVSYEKLFPKVAAVIHHGGIGTISLVLAAGKPQIAVPFAHDQPDNAFRIEKLKIGVKIKPDKFNCGNVYKKLTYLLKSETIINNCIEYSKKINFEDSIQKIINHVESFGEKFVDSTKSYLQDK